MGSGEIMLTFFTLRRTQACMHRTYIIENPTVIFLLPQIFPCIVQYSTVQRDRHTGFPRHPPPCKEGGKVLDPDANISKRGDGGGEESLLLVWLEGALRYLLGGGGLRLVTVP